MGQSGHYRELLVKHLNEAKKSKNARKEKILQELLKKYDSLSSFKNALELIRNRNELEKYLQTHHDEIKSVLKERERTALVGHKLEELIYQLFSGIAEHFGLEVYKGPVLTWVGFSPNAVDKDFELKTFEMNADVAIGKWTKLVIDGEEYEYFVPLVFVTAKEMIEFYITRQISKEAENAKLSNPNLLFLVICAETEIGSDKTDLMNIWLKDVDGFYVFRNCKRGQKKPYDANIIRACETQVYEHLEKIRKGEQHREKVRGFI